MLKIWKLCSKCRNACIIICSKAEVFIHVPEMFVHAAGQNFMWLSYTELKVTATGLNIQQLLIFFSSRKQHQRTIHTSNLPYGPDQLPLILFCTQFLSLSIVEMCMRGEGVFKSLSLSGHTGHCGSSWILQPRLINENLELEER